MNEGWLYLLKPLLLLLGIIFCFELKDRLAEHRIKRRRGRMKETATSVMEWETPEEAAAYFVGQGQKEIGFLNKFEFMSLEKLQGRLGCSKGELSAEINNRLSQNG